jgi:hypothetical protein
MEYCGPLYKAYKILRTYFTYLNRSNDHPVSSYASTNIHTDRRYYFIYLDGCSFRLSARVFARPPVRLSSRLSAPRRPFFRENYFQLVHPSRRKLMDTHSRSMEVSLEQSRHLMIIHDWEGERVVKRKLNPNGESRDGDHQSIDNKVRKR